MNSAKRLTNILQRVANDQNYKNFNFFYKSKPSSNMSFTSDLYQATISAPGKNDLNLFIKVGAMGETMRSKSFGQIYKIESCFYRDIKKYLEIIEQQNSVLPEHRLITPKIYAAKNETRNEVLVLEDLTAAGYQVYDRCTPITCEYAKSSLKILSKLHALSIFWSTTQPEAFKMLIYVLKLQITPEHFRKYFQKVVKNAIEVTKESNKEKLLKFAQGMTFDKYINNIQKPVRRTVIAFGDYQPNNLFHKLNDDGSYDIIPFDYKTLRIGNPIADVMNFLLTGSDKAFRRKYFYDVFELYYAEVCGALERLNMNPDNSYPREVFEFELQKVLPFGLLLSMSSLLSATVNPEDAPKVHEIKELADLALPPNKLYIERLNDIIDDYIDMGIL